jgi:hypothetical protein
LLLLLEGRAADPARDGADFEFDWVGARRGMSTATMDAAIGNKIEGAVEAAAGPYAWVGKVAREWGIFAAMTAFFIWQSVIREGALNKRADSQAEFIQKTLTTTIENNTRAFESFKAALERKQP